MTKGYAPTPAYERALARSEIRDMGYVTPCRIFTGRLNNGGYGVIFWSKLPGEPRRKSVHRVAYEHHHGAVPDRLDVDHLCHVKACFEISHLEAVTRSLNLSRRRPFKRRWQTRPKEEVA